MHHEIRIQQLFRTYVWIFALAACLLIWTVRFLPSWAESANLEALDTEGSVHGWSRNVSIREPEDLNLVESLDDVTPSEQSVESQNDDNANERSSVVKSKALARSILSQLNGYRAAHNVLELESPKWLVQLAEQQLTLLSSHKDKVMKSESIADLSAKLANGHRIHEGYIRHSVSWQAKLDEQTELSVRNDIAEYWLSRKQINGLEESDLSMAAITISEHSDGYIALMVLFKPLFTYQNYLPIEGEGVVKAELAPGVFVENLRLYQQTGDCSWLLDVPELPEQIIPIHQSADKTIEFNLPKARHSQLYRWFECDWQRLRFYYDDKPIHWGKVLFEKTRED